MTLLTEKGTFAKETSNVDGTDQTVTLANGSLTPKILWLWTTGSTTNATYEEDYMVSYGFSDGTDDACVAGGSEDNETASEVSMYLRNDAICVILDAATTPATINAQADVVSFGAGSFTLNWAVSDGVASIIHYMVVGGTDITNVKLVYTEPDNTGAGTINITGAGFTPVFVNALYLHETYPVNTADDIFHLFIAAATSSSATWMVGNVIENGAANADTYTVKQTTGFWRNYSPTTAGLNMTCEFSAFTSDGCDLTIFEAGTNPGVPMAFLFVAGGLWNVGSGTAPAEAGQQTINTTSGRDPEMVMMFSWGDTTTSSGAAGEAQARFGIGGADNSLNEGSISVHDTDAGANMISTRVSVNTKMLRVHTADATAASSTTLAEADIIDMDNDGNFIVDWTTTLSGMGYTFFTVSQAFAAPAGADEERYLAVNTIPSLTYPASMSDLLSKIGGSRTNVRTFAAQSELDLNLNRLLTKSNALRYLPYPASQTTSQKQDILLRSMLCRV